MQGGGNIDVSSCVAVMMLGNPNNVVSSLARTSKGACCCAVVGPQVESPVDGLESSWNIVRIFSQSSSARRDVVQREILTPWQAESEEEDAKGGFAERR